VLQTDFFEHEENSRELNDPTIVRREQIVVHDPLGQLVPLTGLTTVNRHTVLGHLILALLHLLKALFRNVRVVLTFDKIRGLQEHISQFAFAERVVLHIELIEALERVTGLAKSLDPRGQ
jgi:hypothetical protein